MLADGRPGSLCVAWLLTTALPNALLPVVPALDRLVTVPLANPVVEVLAPTVPVVELIPGTGKPLPAVVLPLTVVLLPTVVVPPGVVPPPVEVWAPPAVPPPLSGGHPPV